MNSVEASIALLTGCALAVAVWAGWSTRRLRRDHELLASTLKRLREDVLRETEARRKSETERDQYLRVLRNVAGLTGADVEKLAAMTHRVSIETTKIVKARHPSADSYGSPPELQVFQAAKLLVGLAEAPGDEQLAQLLQVAVKTSFRPRVSHTGTRMVTRVGERIVSGQSYDRHTEEYEYEEEEQIEVIDSPSHVAIEIDLTSLGLTEMPLP